jgi:hypothetical protein
MTKQFYITDRATWAKHVANGVFCHERGTSFVELPDGSLIVAAHFPVKHEEACQFLFESDPAVEALPHPMYEGSVELDDRHTDKIKLMKDKPNGNDVFPDKAQRGTDANPKVKTTIRDVARAMAKVHPHFYMGKRF